MPRATTTERSRPMKRTNNGILIPDVPIMAGGNLPNAVKGVSAGGNDWKKHAVDMGLPSGTLWADCDIDVNMPDGFCVTPFIYEKSFFSWGNVEGCNPIGGSSPYNFNWDNYRNSQGNELETNIPLDRNYDAARFHNGTPWHMPSHSNASELLEYSIYVDANGEEIVDSDKTTEINGIKGICLKSRINGNLLFFACGGYIIETSYQIGNYQVGHYWTRDFFDSTKAGSLLIGAEPDFLHKDEKRFGFNIRPIANPYD